MSDLLVTCPLAAVAAALLCYLTRRLTQRLPPGPKGLPLLGSLFHAPTEFQWLVFRDWSDRYDSDVLHFDVLGTNYIVLNSAKAASDLFDKRSNIYSDKPEPPVSQMCGWDRNMGLLGYSEFWREHRRLFHQYFHSTAVPAYHPSTKLAVREMLRGLRDTPKQFKHHIRFMTGSNILRIMFAMEVQPEGDPYIALIEESAQIFIKTATPGIYLVDSFPLLRHISTWFPGAQFKRDAAKWRPIVEAMFMRPYRPLKALFDRGNPTPCLLSSMLADISRDREGKDRTMLENVVINTSGTAYAAASDTTTSTLLTFILTMMLYPDVQKAAQKELDDVVGRDRLPEMEDRDALPSITALVKECLRWRPPLPLGVPHRSTADDEYRGYRIPARSTVIGNAWAILHDAERYLDPEAFKPSRFLDAEGRLRKDVPDPVEAFGYGRRICPGRYYLLDFVWLAVANILAVYSIEKPVEEQGNVVEPSEQYSTGTIVFPVPCEAVFNVRAHVDVSAL